MLRASFPAGTLSGAPKIRAMEIIDELEPVQRGVYGGAVGYLSFAGDMDGRAIRTGVIWDHTLCDTSREPVWWPIRSQNWNGRNRGQRPVR